MTILDDMVQIGVLMQKDVHGVQCQHCDQYSTVEYRRLEHQYWCSHCKIYFGCPHEPDRKVAHGMVKDSLGYVHEDTCTSIHDFHSDLGSNS